MRSFARLFSLALILVAPASADPLSDALAATEAPVSLRVAFDVELKSAAARQVFRFDPRWPEGRQWKLLEDEGEDAFLDEVAATWGAEVAPDGRLFPDDLRESIGDGLEIDTIGPAQRLRFRHSPSANDGEFDIWAAERLSATAWLSPEAGRFLRIDYALPRPVRGPEGGRLIRFDQSYFLENDPEFGVSLITAISVDFEARGGFRRIAKNYRARILKAEVFFATREEETRFLSSRNALASES